MAELGTKSQTALSTAHTSATRIRSSSPTTQDTPAAKSRLTGDWASIAEQGVMALVEELAEVKEAIDNIPFVDFPLRVSQGVVTGYTPVQKFGSNDAVGTTQVDIWDGGGDYTGWISSAEKIDLVSDDADDDDPSGNGARKVQVYGLDASWALQNEEVLLAGATPVSTANTYIRVFRMVVTEAGSTGSNEGTITADGNVSSSVVSVISPGNNQTLQANYSIPAATTAYLTSYYFGIGKKTAGSADIKLWVRPFGESLQLKHKISGNSTGTGTHQHRYDFPLSIAAKSDIVISGTGSVASMEIDAGFYLVEDSN